MQSHVSATFQNLICRQWRLRGRRLRRAGTRQRNRNSSSRDGIGRHRRERVFAKALAPIKRLVVIGHEGAMTLEALRWLVRRRNCPSCRSTATGEIIAASAKLRSQRSSPASGACPGTVESSRPRNSALSAFREARRSGNGVCRGRNSTGNARAEVARCTENARNAMSTRRASWPRPTARWPIGARGRRRGSLRHERRRNQFPSTGSTFGQRSSPSRARRVWPPIPQTRCSTTSTRCLRRRRVLPV